MGVIAPPREGDFPLPCPECRAHGSQSKRIGNRRNACTTCNNFGQNVIRISRQRLKEKHTEEYNEIRLQVELDLYPQVIEEWSARNLV
jgi:hypothetical protein